MVSLKIEVTQEDIDKGCRYDSSGKRGGCMVWRAMQRATEGSLEELSVNSDYIRYGEKGKEVFVMLPQKVGRKIIAFDVGKQVNPFEFELELPISS